MERLLHSAALAICEAVSDLLNIIFRIISSFERGSLGAMLRRNLDVDGGEFWQGAVGER